MIGQNWSRGCVSLTWVLTQQGKENETQPLHIRTSALYFICVFILLIMDIFLI